MSEVPVNILRTSDRGQFKRCRQAWDFGSKVRQNYEPNTESVYLSFGTCIHAALEVYYSPHAWFQHDNPTGWACRLTHAERLAFAQQAFVAEAKKYNLEEEDVNLGLAMLEHYSNFYRNEDWVPLLVEKEFEIEMEVDGLEFVYQGRIDLVVETATGIWIVDHKTAARFDDMEWLNMDEQCGSYKWALHKLGIDVKGVIYNQLRKAAPAPPKVLKNGKLSTDKSQPTTYELYVKAIGEHNQSFNDYADMLAFLKGAENTFFRRHQVLRNDTELAVLEERIKAEALDMFTNPRIYPNPSKFNCGYCAYRDPCLALAEGGDYAYFLNQNFHKRK